MRGVTLNLDVLCATLGPPAAMIPPIPPLEAGQTNRQRIDSCETVTCGMSCHNDIINPLGFVRALRRHGTVCMTTKTAA